MAPVLLGVKPGAQLIGVAVVVGLVVEGVGVVGTTVTASKNIDFLIVLLFMGQRWVFFGQKPVLGCFWTECDKADLKQRQD